MIVGPGVMNEMVPLWTGSLKVAVMSGAAVETPVAPFAGVMPVTVGGDGWLLNTTSTQ